MSAQIIKCARDVDLYLEWSSVTESPTAVGDRLDFETALTVAHSPAYAARTLTMADTYGTSSPGLGCTWDDEGERYRNGGRLPRDRMAEFARRLLVADPEASPDVLIADLLVPIDYGESV